ncbi:MAG: dinitrogenase iron-molybdenum cofactor [Firmicutes bacterium]|nr:dinitrogenase iron-molybdenum cofactor [Bacillota bacterium]
MKIAIATDSGNVAQHFGRCPAYTLVEFADGEVVGKEVIDNPGHQPGFLPGFLAKYGVSCIIAGGMGWRAQDLFAAQNIKAVVGVTGPVEQVIDDYLSGNLQSGESLCNHEFRGEHHHGGTCEREQQ